VLSRKDQKLVRIDGLKDQPKKGPEVAVGSEPTGMAMTPLGHTIWVASWMNGTVTAYDTATLKPGKLVDLSATLAASGYPGKTLAARPSLSHPRSVAITNNGDEVEDDETMFVTEFYAQQKAPLAADGSNLNGAVGIQFDNHANGRLAKGEKTAGKQFARPEHGVALSQLNDLAMRLDQRAGFGRKCGQQAVAREGAVDLAQFVRNHLMHTRRPPEADSGQASEAVITPAS
jgi:hypothetical protein